MAAGLCPHAGFRYSSTSILPGAKCDFSLKLRFSGWPSDLIEINTTRYHIDTVKTVILNWIATL